METEHLTIEKWTDWIIRLSASQDPIGQVELAVNRRKDGQYANDMTTLNTGEQFSLNLLSRTVRQTVEYLYHPVSFKWIFSVDQYGRCLVHMISQYLVNPGLSLEPEEIAQQIRETIPLIRTGKLP